MKLSRKRQRELIEKCKETVSGCADRLPDESYLGAAYRQGRLSAVLDEMLPPLVAEVGIMEAMHLASLARKYGAAEPRERMQMERQMREIVLCVAARIPGHNENWEPALDSLQAMATSLHGPSGPH